MSWLDKAACRGENPAIFYPEDFLRKADQVAAETEALAICGRCSVKQDCLDDTLGDRPATDQGIRGGLTEDQRRVLRRTRGQAVHLSLREKRQDPDYRAFDNERRNQQRAVAG